MGIDDQVQRKGYRNHTLSTLDQIRNLRIGVIRAGGEILFATYNGMLTNPVPVTEKVAVDMGQMGMLEFPNYRWHFYNIHGLANLGLSVEDDDIVAGLASVDIEDNTNYVRVSDVSMTLNWFAPQSPGGYVAADSVLAAMNMKNADLTKNGGSWTPVLEPITNAVPNYQVLGYSKDEIIWMGTGNGNSNNQ